MKSKAKPKTKSKAKLKVVKKTTNKKVFGIFNRRCGESKERDTPKKDYDGVSKGGWKSKWFARNNIKSYLIRMNLRNGNGTEFVVAPKGRSFVYQKETYVIDESIKFWIVESRMYALEYLQGFSLPIKTAYNTSNIRTAIKSSGLIETELVTNPKVLQDFVDSKIAEGVMKGQAIDEWLKSLKMWIMVGTIVGVIHLVLFAQKSGMLSKLGG